MKQFSFALMAAITAAIVLFSNYIKAQTDTLPFAISEVKKLGFEELANKKEGTYVTGVPELSSDPINGIGYGVEGSLIFDGKKTNPFFKYTPYISKLDLAIFNTSRNQREIALKFDHPYIFRTKWRLRLEAAYEINPNLLFFGIDKASLDNLAQLSVNDHLPIPAFTGKHYGDYASTLIDDYSGFNQYTKEELIVNISGEYALLDSKIRVLAGIEAAGLNISNPDKYSRIFSESVNEKILGFGKSFITFLQNGIVWDKRDFEPDPNKGIFAELTNELALQSFASNYNFDKVFTQVKVYKRLFPAKFKKIIAAGRAGIGYTFGDAPFFEYQDEWSSEGSIEGLGGAHTLRGYKQSRFLDRGQYFVNAELRTRFAQATVFEQHLVFSAVPFADAGSVYNAKDIFHIANLRYDGGLGMRIAWNESTILRFDYAVSKEDRQFFFIFGHSF